MTCAFDGTVRLWDAESGLEALTLHGRYFQTPHAAASHDGGYIASTWNDGTLRIWDLRPWTDRSRDEEEARGLVAHLRAQSLNPAAIIEAIRSDTTITETVRSVAAKLTDSAADPGL